jgi:membrane fusion protein, multidrug efflux system
MRGRRFGLSNFALSVLAAALFLVALVVAVTSLRSFGADADGGGDDNPPLPVPTLTVSYSTETAIQTRFSGLVTARRESALGFDMPGRIAEIGVDVGDRVAPGDILARLDTRALEANLAAARADARAARASADLAQTTYQRQQTLVDQGHVSRQRLDEAQSSAQAARAQADAADAAAEVLEVQIDLARLDAPYAGVITSRAFDEGAVAPAGQPVLTLVEEEGRELRIGLPAGEAARLETGTLYPVLADGTQYQARVIAVTGIIDRQSRSVTAVLRFEEGAPASGAVARLVLETGLDERGFWAPVTALAEGRRGLWSVYVLSGDGPYTLEPRPVEILHTEEDRVYLRGAVEEGALVLSAGLQRVTPGQGVVPAGQGA